MQSHATVEAGQTASTTQLGETQRAAPRAPDGERAVEAARHAGATPSPDAQRALALARDHLLSLQKPDGHWRGLLETNVTMDAEDLLLRAFLGITDG